MNKAVILATLLIFSWSIHANPKDPIEKLTADGNSSENQFEQNKNSRSTKYYGPNDRLVCESRRGERQHCGADTSGGVRLTKEFSRNRCRGNWGYDYYGVWVRNGCKAEFSIDRYQDHYGQTNDIVRCESYGFRRKSCPINLNGASVTLIHQLSNRPCQNNWSYNRNEIWVENGCKADFHVYRNNSGYPGHPGDDQNVILVECRSNGSNINYCNVPDLSAIELTEDLSFRNNCKGNWGYASNGIWVRGGCHARFAVTPYRNLNNPGFPGSGGNRPPNETFTIKCKSRKYMKVFCDTNGPVRDAEMKREISAGKYPCRGNWGVDSRGRLFVDNNCYGEFKVYR